MTELESDPITLRVTFKTAADTDRSGIDPDYAERCE